MMPGFFCEGCLRKRKGEKKPGENGRGNPALSVQPPREKGKKKGKGGGCKGTSRISSTVSTRLVALRGDHRQATKRREGGVSDACATHMMAQGQRGGEAATTIPHILRSTSRPRKGKGEGGGGKSYFIPPIVLTWKGGKGGGGNTPPTAKSATLHYIGRRNERTRIAQPRCDRWRSIERADDSEKKGSDPA